MMVKTAELAQPVTRASLLIRATCKTSIHLFNTRKKKPTVVTQLTRVDIQTMGRIVTVS